MITAPRTWLKTSRYAEKIRPHVKENGALYPWTSHGYPLFYIVESFWGLPERRELDVMCAQCASTLHEHEEGNRPSRVTDVDVNWEDRELYCDCGARIPSAYAEDESP